MLCVVTGDDEEPLCSLRGILTDEDPAQERRVAGARVDANRRRAAGAAAGASRDAGRLQVAIDRGHRHPHLRSDLGDRVTVDDVSLAQPLRVDHGASATATRLYPLSSEHATDSLTGDTVVERDLADRAPGGVRRDRTHRVHRSPGGPGLRPSSFVRAVDVV